MTDAETFVKATRESDDPVEARVVGIATQGLQSNDAERLRGLLAPFNSELLPVRNHGGSTKVLGIPSLVDRVLRAEPDLVVLEGTGLAGGLASLLVRAVAGIPFVVSTGDAVGPYVAARKRSMGPIFALYERILYRFSAGVIGWTPYLVGRALTFGAPRAMTAPGWSAPLIDSALWAGHRARTRASLNIPQSSIIVGLAGSLNWNERLQYCYGHELVRAARRIRRPDLVVLIVGGGTGLSHLRALAGDMLGKSIHLIGPVPRHDLLPYLAAMDIGSLPQSCDKLGSFRYSTKMADYAAARLPTVTGTIPAAYDLDSGWLWRLRGDAPWSIDYIDNLVAFLEQVDSVDISQKRDALAQTLPAFDERSQRDRVTAFLTDVLSSSTKRSHHGRGRRWRQRCL